MGGFLIRTVYLVCAKNKMKAVVGALSISELALTGDGIGAKDKAGTGVPVNRWRRGLLLS